VIRAANGFVRPDDVVVFIALVVLLVVCARMVHGWRAGKKHHSGTMGRTAHRPAA
jgi:hypothetical protein